MNRANSQQPVMGIPIVIKDNKYKLKECKKRGCKILLPADLVYCGIHTPREPTKEY